MKIEIQLIKICGSYKTVPYEKLIALNAYIWKKERSKKQYLNLHHRKLTKEGQIKSKVSKRNKIIKIRAEIIEMEKRNTIK